MSLIDLLAVRHADDVFVTKCKNGPSQGSAHLRMDAWAMAKSWANPLTWGYEIKVSRSDFVRDKKWHGYLPYCSEFYFVCPAGLIKPDELPPEAGLICASETGTKLFTKKKAQRRSVQIPEDLWRYVLMCRARIGPERNDGDSRTDFWREWLRKKDEDKELGYHVSRSIRKLVECRIENVQRDITIVRAENKRFEAIRNMLASMGFDEKYVPETWDLQRKIDALQSKLPPGFIGDARRLRDGLAVLLEAIDPDKPAQASKMRHRKAVGK